ncbi:MAG: peptide chain release factor-like protein [Planctomycetota bacterium]
MPADPPPAGVHPAAQPIDELLRSCEARRFRASGPGGQHRNKVETAVELTHRPTGVSGRATERRSQEANRQTAIFRLRVELALKVRTELSADAQPSDTWRARVRSGKLAINPTHDDFPALLAEALNHLAAVGHDHAAAADRLGVSPSQLLKLLRHDPRGLQTLNAARAASGLSALK